MTKEGLKISKKMMTSVMIDPFYLEKIEKKNLPVGELNPGLPRDRRGYLPLY